MPIDNTGLPWEARGTVSLVQNSNIVSGVGTSFADNVRPRDALFVDGFEQPLEISSVNGATEIQLENQFVGADITSANFKILRGYNWNLVAKLAATQAELLAQWRNIQTVYQSESPPQNANEGSINFNVADVADPRFQIKENGAWSDSYTLRGPVGLGWVSGAGSPSNTTGEDGEFYLNLIDSEYHGPKENGIWPSATKIKGDKGDKGTIGIGTIITGQPGTDVQVINSGTEENVILDISIPRGDPFIINAEGIASNRTLFDDEFEGFVFYETDNQQAFQRIGPSGQWVGPLVFGAGDMSGANNLSELTDIALSRQNLGAMSGENNLSELTDIALSRQNLGAMSGDNNLSELTDIGLARQNLGAMSGDNNLSELTDIGLARQNLGAMSGENNLSELTDVALSRQNMGIDNFSGKNKIINGNFDVWQRGTSQTNNGYGSDDRWANVHLGATKIHSQQAFIPGQNNVSNEPKFYSRTVVNSVVGAENFCAKSQKIEGVRTYAGQVVTLSFYAKADLAKNISVELVQDFGTGGSPSSSISGIGTEKVSLTAEWQKFTIKITVPSISGKTIGINGNDNLCLTIWFEAGSNYDLRTNMLGQQSGTFDIAQIQLEQGAAASDFENLHLGQILYLCYRYYWKNNVPDSWANAYSSDNSTALRGANFIFPAPMRVQPAISIVSQPTYNGCSHHGFVTRSFGFCHRLNKDSYAGVYRAYAGVYAADAEI